MGSWTESHLDLQGVQPNPVKSNVDLRTCGDFLKKKWLPQPEYSWNPSKMLLGGKAPSHNFT